MKRMKSCLALVAALLTLLSSTASAQSLGSVEHYVTTGREYFEAGDFDNAARHFREGTSLHPNEATLYLYLGQAYTRLVQRSQATAAFQRAVALSPSLGPRVRALSSGSAGSAGSPLVLRSRIDQAPFKAGDPIEVQDFGNDTWFRGTVVSVRDNSDDGSLFVYRVRYRTSSHTDPSMPSAETTFYPDNVRAVRTAPSRRAAPPRAASNVLVSGDYVCRTGYWAGPPGNQTYRQEPQGILSVRANGTYSFRGGSGRYRYDPATQEVVWVSGYLSQDRATTKFTRHDATTAGLAIAFHTASGDLHWVCGADVR